MALDPDLSSMMKKRVAAKGWLSRAMKKAQDLLSGDQPDEEALKLVCKEMETRLSSLDELQSDVELIIESESDELEDIEKASVYRDSVVTVPSNVSKTHDLRGDSESGFLASSQSVKLPKLDLPKFGVMY